MNIHNLKAQWYACECGFQTIHLKVFIHHVNCPEKPIGNIQLKDFLKNG